MILSWLWRLWLGNALKWSSYGLSEPRKKEKEAANVWIAGWQDLI
jgi:hypothetical protein